MKETEMNWHPHVITDRPTTDDLGYVLLYYPEHPRAQKHGYVPRSRLVMENMLGRYLSEDETVWHKDRVRDNDAPDNLTLEAPRKLPTIKCRTCGQQFQQRNSRIRYCSPKCGAISTHRCRHPSKDMLQWMVWDRPTMDVAQHFGVTDKAVEKWCRRLGVVKPGRGYWAKVHAGKIRRKNPYRKPRR